MPRIPDIFLDSVIYLYRTVDAARSGESAGGTGFLVGIQSEKHPNVVFLYAVTNNHVINYPDSSAPVIRLNMRQGDTHIVELRPDDWVSHPDNVDLAAIQLYDVDPNRLKFSFVDVDLSFVSKSMIDDYDIGPGNEVFTIVRFIGIDGKQRNEPTIRFGNISMMPSEPVVDFYGHQQECFLVETRSLRGSSGSPVFINYQPSVWVNYDAEHSRSLHRDYGVGPWLLGIAFSDVPYRDDVILHVKNQHGEVIREEETDFVALSNSGLMAVIPAWKLRDFLVGNEKFIMARKEADKIIKEKK